jgi:hypothetical protein
MPDRCQSIDEILRLIRRKSNGWRGQSEIGKKRNLDRNFLITVSMKSEIHSNIRANAYNNLAPKLKIHQWGFKTQEIFSKSAKQEEKLKSL